MTPPLVQPEVDLRGMPFMPLDIVRLFDSDLFAISTGDEFKAAVALWGRSWHQVPAASLPDDDRILAHLSGTGTRWQKLKDIAMRGWIKCSDGRWYHPVVAEKAAEAWKYRLAQRERAAKRWQGHGNAGAHAVAYPVAMQGTETGTETVNNSKALSGGAPDGARDRADKTVQRREAEAAGKRAIEYLNAKAGTRYRPTKANLKFPVDRIVVDGATETDLVAVVDLKAKDAIAGDFDPKYLRPETLWNATKFGSYIGQVGAQPPARAASPEVLKVYSESEAGVRGLVSEYPIGDMEEAARRALTEYRSAPWMRSTRNLVVRVNGTESRFSVDELRRAH